MKYHNRKSPRYKDYDYNLPGYYFVTICTHNMQSIFGDVLNRRMRLNKYGDLAEKFWNEIPEHFTNVELDYYQIMPNHIHGIIIINPVVGNAKFAFPTVRPQMLLSKIIQQYKRKVTIEIKTQYNKHIIVWQKSFYDRIIRNEKELYKIRKYTLLNPFKWALENDDAGNLDI